MGHSQQDASELRVSVGHCLLALLALIDWFSDLVGNLLDVGSKDL